MEFSYVVQRKEKGKVCFGSGLERKTLEADTRGLVSKHARENLRENYPDVGPASYDLSKITATSALLNKPTSRLGTVLGGRRAELKKKSVGFENPGPCDYNIPPTFPIMFKQFCAPFNSTLIRRAVKVSKIPSPGVYNVAPYKHRSIPFAHTFGGKKCLKPAVKMKCGPYNFDICELCKKNPEGDYWYIRKHEMLHLAYRTKDSKKSGSKKKPMKIKADRLFLCRPCYDLEKIENSVFNKAQIRSFKKIRDCSKVHFHGGCQQKMYLVPPKEIVKVNVKEAYLSLYFKRFFCCRYCFFC